MFKISFYVYGKKYKRIAIRARHLNGDRLRVRHHRVLGSLKSNNVRISYKNNDVTSTKSVQYNHGSQLIT